MGIKIITPPATEPVTLAEAKAHLRVDVADEDAMITRMISAARDHAEQELDRAIGAQTLELLLDEFPDGAIRLPRGPASSIVSIKYVDTSGVLQTISSLDYTLDDAQIDSWVLPAFDYSWPDVRDEANSVRVRYVTGWTACPAPVTQWILLVLATLYAVRESDSDKPAVPQQFAARLLDRYKAHVL